MSVSARLEPAFFSVRPAATAESVLHLRNTGEIVEAYRFELVGAPAEWGMVEPAELSLYPGTAGTVAIRVSPPRGTEPEAGRYPFAVRAVPVERPEDVQVPEGVVEVLPAADLEAGLVARTRRGRLGARFQIAVRNAGNIAAVIAADAQEPDGKLRFRARPEAEDFQPGDEGHFRVVARPRRLMLKGRGRTHSFRVTVTLREVPPDGAPEAEPEPAPELAPQPAPETLSKTLDAVYEQRPIIPAGAGKMLAAAVALAALFAAAWFFMVKPAVTSAANSTASHVAAAVLAQQTSAPAGAASSPGNQGAPTPSKPGSGSASRTPSPSGTTTPSPKPTSATSPSPSPSPSPSKPSPTGPSAPGTTPTTPAPPPTPSTPATTTANFDTSLAVQVKPGQSGTATFTTPARSTFMITDYVLENPQGDYGTIVVNVNGRQVSVLALEDFRDDDYPWVTPLEVPAGAHVSITVNCNAAGTPPNAVPPTTCSESGLFNGTMTTVSK